MKTDNAVYPRHSCSETPVGQLAAGTLAAFVASSAVFLVAPEFDLVRRYLGPSGLFTKSEDNGWFITGCLLTKDTELAVAPEAPVKDVAPVKVEGEPGAEVKTAREPREVK